MTNCDKTNTGPRIVLDDGAKLNAPLLVKRSLRVGKGTLIDHGLYCTCNAIIGKYCHIAPLVYMIGGDGLIEIGDFSAVAAGSKLLCASDNYTLGGLQHPAIPKEFVDDTSPIRKNVKIGKAVLLGMNTIVLPGVNIPDGVSTLVNTIIGEATELIPYGVYAGNGRKIGSRNRDLIEDQMRKINDYCK